MHGIPLKCEAFLDPEVERFTPGVSRSSVSRGQEMTIGHWGWNSINSLGSLVT